MEMTPELVLRIFKGRGLDLHETVIYRPGQGILSHQHQSDAVGLVNEVLVEGGDKLLSIASHSGSQAAYGRREGYLSASNIKEGLSEYGQAYLSRAAYPSWGLQGTVTGFDGGGGNPLKPFESYFIGDLIGWTIPPGESGEPGFDGTLKVRGVTVSENADTGALSYTLELNSLMLEHEIRLNQKVERMSQFGGADVLSVAPSSSGGYSTSEVNAMLSAKAEVGHLHTGVYSETDHIHDFLGLTDTPESYLGQGGKALAVKADGSGLEFVTAGSGGESGGTYYANPMDAPPDIPHACDDEFDGGSLDAKWAWVNQGNASIELKNGKLYMNVPACQVQRLIRQLAPAGSFTAIAKVNLQSNEENYFAFGLGGYNSANDRMTVICKGARGGYRSTHVVRETSTSWSADTWLRHGIGGVDLYVRVVKDDTTLSFSYSLDGGCWIPVWSETVSSYLGAVTHIVLSFMRNNTSSGQFAYGVCDFVRVTEP